MSSDRTYGLGASSSRWLFVPLLVSLPLLFWFLGSSSVVDGDESIYVLLARGLLRGESLLFPTLDDRVFLAKPPFFLWLIAASQGIFGMTEWAARLPFALCGAGVVGLTGVVSAKITNDKFVGVICGLVLAFNPQFLFLHCSRRAEPDVFFLFWMTASLAVFPFERRGSGWKLAAALFFAGLAGFSKTLAVSVFPLALIGALLILLPKERRPRLSVSRVSLGALAFLVAVVPWHVIAWAVHGQAFFDSYFQQQTLSRFQAPELSYVLQCQRYGSTALAAFHPLWPLALVGLVSGCRRGGSAQVRLAARFALIWIFIVCAIVFPVLPGRNWYLLPAYPGVSLLIALGAVSCFRAGNRWWSWVSGIACAVGAIGLRIDSSFDPFARLSELASLDLRLVAGSVDPRSLLASMAALFLGVIGLRGRSRGGMNQVASAAIGLSIVGFLAGGVWSTVATLSRGERESTAAVFARRSREAFSECAPIVYFGSVFPRLDHRVVFEPPGGRLRIACDDSTCIETLAEASEEFLVYVPAQDLDALREVVGQRSFRIAAMERLLIGYVPDEPELVLAVQVLGADAERGSRITEWLEEVESEELFGSRLLVAAYSLALAESREAVALLFERARALASGLSADGGREQASLARMRDLLGAVAILDDASALSLVTGWIREPGLRSVVRFELVLLSAFLGEEKARQSLLRLAEDRVSEGKRVGRRIIRALWRRDFHETLRVLARSSRPLEETASLLLIAAGKSAIFERSDVFADSNDEALQLLGVALFSQKDGREVVLDAKETELAREVLRELRDDGISGVVRDAAGLADAGFHPSIWKTW